MWPRWRSTWLLLFTFSIASVCVWVLLDRRNEQDPQQQHRRTTTAAASVADAAEEEQKDLDIRWLLLLESPLKQELQMILDARDLYWMEKMDAVIDKKKREWDTLHQQKLQVLQDQIKQLEQQQQQQQPQQKPPQQQQPPQQQPQPRILRPYGESFHTALQPIDSFYITSNEEIINAAAAQCPTATTTTKDTNLIYFITPTVYRTTQMADLTRLGQTLVLAQLYLNQPQQQQSKCTMIYWIVVEDVVATSQGTRRIRNLLVRLGLLFAHVVQPSSPIQAHEKFPPRGVEQRNHALTITKEIGIPGVIYFGDDDNAYDIRLFPELCRLLTTTTTKCRHVGILPVAFRGGGHYERCLVIHNNSNNNKDEIVVSDIVEKVPTKRKYPMDMAGLVYHTSLIWSKNPTFSNTWPNGQQETRFLDQLIHNMSELEPLAYNCTHFFVWHLKTHEPPGPFKVWPDPDYDILKNLV